MRAKINSPLVGGQVTYSPNAGHSDTARAHAKADPVIVYSEYPSPFMTLNWAKRELMPNFSIETMEVLALPQLVRRRLHRQS